MAVEPELDDGFEIIAPTEADALLTDESIPPAKVRKLCACGCGEEVTGNRALKRGHSMGTGLQASVWGADDIFVLQSAFIGMLTWGTIWIEHKRQIARMEPEEASALAAPSARIFARHFPKKLLKYMKPGDVSDAVAIMTVFTAYTVRVTTSKKVEQPNLNGISGYEYDQTVSGLNQYSYHPPEQVSQQENGATN
jgi:hypothetical protein